MKKGKILITGANGFLAKNLFYKLNKDSFEIVGLIREGNEIFNDGFSNVYKNVAELLSSEEDFDFIFHLAANIPYGHYNDPNPQLIKDNLELTLTLTKKYPEAKHILSSSVSVYGSQLNMPININSPLITPTLYGLSKLASEFVVECQKKYAIVRFSSIIGPGMKAITFIPKLIENALIKKDICIFGNGNRTQDYIDVRDAASLLFTCALSHGNQKFLGVSGKSCSNKDVATFVSNVTGIKIRNEGVDNSPSFSYDPESSYIDINYAPQFSLEQTIKDMINEA